MRYRDRLKRRERRQIAVIVALGLTGAVLAFLLSVGIVGIY